MNTFFKIAEDSEFSIANLPFGVAKRASSAETRVYVAVGDQALDLAALESQGHLKTGSGTSLFLNQPLNSFASQGRAVWKSVREQIIHVLTGENPILKDSAQLQQVALIPQAELQMQLPFHIGGFTDFYASEFHATNVGRMFRGEANALMPNWKHIPIAYNGRASTVVIDGTPIRRPNGQIKKPDVPPIFGPSRKLDFELEVGVFIAKENALGQPISKNEAADYLFGLVLVNDWSARDIQSWEYQPLGPFLGKSFATTISPWVVPFAALESVKRPLPEQTPAVLPYLKGPHFNYDIDLSAEIRLGGKGPYYTLCKTNLMNMYWSFEQQLLHHASNGCVMRVGDLLASGTLSGKEPTSSASLLELSFDGKSPLNLDGQTRSFLEDGDELVLKGVCGSPGHKVGFGRSGGVVLAANPFPGI